MGTLFHAQKKRWSGVWRQAFFSVSFLLVMTVPVLGQELILGTDSKGSFSHFMGKNICRVINSELKEHHCQVESIEDSTVLVTNLQTGAIDFALLDSIVLNDAIKSTGYFSFLSLEFNNLRTLCTLFEVPLTVVVQGDRKIDSFAEVKKEWFNVGAPNSEEQRAIDLILEAKQWTRDDFSLIAELPSSLSQDNMAFNLGSIGAMLHKGIHPDPSLQRLFSLSGATFIDLNDQDLIQMAEQHPALNAMTIPAGIYTDTQAQVETIGTKVSLIATGELENEAVYAVLTALEKRKKDLQKCHSACAKLNIKPETDEKVLVTFHQGAVQFFNQ